MGYVKGQPIRFIHGHHNRKALPDITPLDLAWLAGILEGEGSFIVNSRTRTPKNGEPWKQVDVRVQINMTDEDVISRVAHLIGRNYRTDATPVSRGHKIKYATEISGHRAVLLMQHLRPLMGRRRQKQIDRANEALLMARREQPHWPRKMKRNNQTYSDDEPEFFR